MKKKIALTISLVILMGATGGFVEYGLTKSDYFSGNPSYILSPLDNYIIDWELGEEIIPYPYVSHPKDPRRWADCDDAVLYSYLYLKALRKDIDIEIRKGKDPWYPQYQHVWLLVSDNETSMVYDWGLPCEQTELYKGRRVTYKQLVSWMYNEF